LAANRFICAHLRNLWLKALLQISALSVNRDAKSNPAFCRAASQSKKEGTMPEKETLERAEQDKREGKSPSTQAGEFVREEIHHIREGKHGAASAKQAVAIGLSKARRAGVELAPPKKGSVSEKTRKAAARDSKRGHSRKKKAVSAKRSRSSETALKREPRSAASHKALSRQAKSAARRRKAA
jgi:hypothetical protein